MAFSRPQEAGLDMRHRLPGLLGRFGGIVAVDADRLLRGLSHPRPPERTGGEERIGGRAARKLLEKLRKGGLFRQSGGEDFEFWILNAE